MPDIFIAEPKNEEPAPLRKRSILEERATSKEKLFSGEDSPIVLRNTVHLFSAFRKDPDGITFRDQEDEETILLFIRRSFITNLKWIFIGSFFAILPILLSFSLGFFQNPLPPLPGKFYLMFELFYYLFVATYWYINFMTWYFNISLITDKRVIDINFSNLVYKDVAATKLNLVQDVSFAQVGAIRTFFDYGDVLIQTAGTLDNFILESAPQPENIVHIVEDLIGRRNELSG
jgi:hypothetical protein